jgi:hypothetical protein
MVLRVAYRVVARFLVENKAGFICALEQHPAGTVPPDQSEEVDTA